MRLRRYQELALEAFEADRAAGRRHTYVVAPPGSGKTTRTHPPAPFVNVLVDATSVAASISTRQTRGRTLTPRVGGSVSPDKVASNWDLVCVAPKLERGVADYERFVRRHAHLHAPCEDGSIESGVSHVHPELSPYAPPRAVDFSALNAHALPRAVLVLRTRARARWRIGEPHRAVELPALLVRAKRRAAAADSGAPIPVDGAKPPGKPRWWLRLKTRRRRFPAVLPLHRVARAVADADVAPAVTQRYVIARPLGDRTYGRAWHPVPSDLARNRERADAYAAAFGRWLGPGELRYSVTSDEGKQALADAAAGSADWEAQTRQLWL